MSEGMPVTDHRRRVTENDFYFGLFAGSNAGDRWSFSIAGWQLRPAKISKGDYDQKDGHTQGRKDI